MESNELTQEQFLLIKALCANHVVLITIPQIDANTPENEKKNILKNSTSLKALQANGFLESRHEDFKEENDRLVALGYNPIEAYSLTDLAYKMFSPPEGSVQ